MSKASRLKTASPFLIVWLSLPVTRAPCWWLWLTEEFRTMTLKTRTATILLGVMIVSGCAQTYTIQSKFNPAEVAWVKKQGNSSLNGEAFLKTVGGEVRTCAGSEVNLIPLSTYSSERVKSIYGNNEKGFASQLGNISGFTNDDPRYYEYSLQEPCDSTGHFFFDKIPSGTYYVSVPVFWKADSNSFLFEGGHLMKKIKLEPKESKRIIMAY